MSTTTRQLRILLVENNEELLGLFKDAMSAFEYEVMGARTFKEAIAIVPTCVPDVVFSAISLKDESGLVLCEHLRKIPETANALLVAITGYGTAFRDAAVAAGFDRYLVKPVQLTTMLETMAHLDGYKGTMLPSKRV